VAGIVLCYRSQMVAFYLRIAAFVCCLFALTPTTTMAKMLSTSGGQTDFPDRIFQCEQDDQCVVVLVPCNGDLAINKTLRGEFEKLVQATIDGPCTSLHADVHNPLATAECRHNNCELLLRSR